MRGPINADLDCSLPSSGKADVVSSQSRFVYYSADGIVHPFLVRQSWFHWFNLRRFVRTICTQGCKALYQRVELVVIIQRTTLGSGNKLPSTRDF